MSAFSLASVIEILVVGTKRVRLVVFHVGLIHLHSSVDYLSEFSFAFSQQSLKVDLSSFTLLTWTNSSHTVNLAAL